jgi:hypothetical protein
MIELLGADQVDGNNASYLGRSIVSHCQRPFGVLPRGMHILLHVGRSRRIQVVLVAEVALVLELLDQYMARFHRLHLLEAPETISPSPPTV